ncbi:Crp/Fnr family transcriptional regulator [Leptospira ilyithenensis]|uniref:Crp/Fnr family transcriptional regulator n=1 Tax=Leptospira ilyithenensis TaxID=2484901 RepID=A0A4R9LYE5_9LEPT|nr:Crp/Fnr family transcriptional regulator [Leptospira ilyithenensis]TGN16805.1 Crp/Fnr family transcriptional regulator [Leptospira ilyithenensis]
MDVIKRLPNEVETALSVSSLRNLPVSFCETLFGRGVLAEYGDSALVNRPGDPIRIALILSGKLRLYYENADGKRLTICRLEKGDLAGVVSLASESNTLYAEAEGVTRLWVIPKESLEETLYKDVNAASVVISELGRHLEKLVGEWIAFAFSTVEERILRYLNGHRKNREPVRISQQQLADEIGTAREVVTRALRKLNQNGVIITDKKGIRLL